MVQPMRISSRDNAKIKYVKRLSESTAFRKQEQLFFAEGIKLCQDLAQNLECVFLFVLKNKEDKVAQLLSKAQETYIINEPVADKLATTKTSQGVFGVFKLPQIGLDDLDVTKNIVLCERIQDAANIGAIMRSAAAFGYAGVILGSGCADPYAPSALRASAGACGHMPVLLDADLEQLIPKLQQKQVRVVATALNDEAQALTDTQKEGAIALLIGNEGAGISPLVLEQCNECIYIPMQQGMQSLNAAVAASVVMFYYASK